MNLGQITLSKSRDFFGLRATLAAFGGLPGSAPHTHRPPRNVILDLQRREHSVRELRVDGEPTWVVAFPHAHRAVAQILTTLEIDGPQDGLDALLPRRTFDQLADAQGAPRMKRIDLAPGVAVDDPVLRHLGACLEHALEPANPAKPAAVDQITASLNLHIAQWYGGLQPAKAPEHGGLVAWQLRRARSIFGRHLDGSIALDAVASECGLSVSHFSRAFRRSTGLAPHQWLVQRRVEVAKDLLLENAMPLAQIALTCGFADQSHFTRAFANQSGLTPARWRTNQERAIALS